jgi:chromosome segregation ATPase
MVLAQEQYIARVGGVREQAEPLRQWLGRLEQKLDALLAAERLLDLQWRQLDASAKAVGGGAADHQFAGLVKAFSDALDQRNRLTTERARTQEDMSWLSDEAHRRQVEFDQIWDRLQALANDFANTAALSLGDIRIKAMVMREFVEENSDDPVHRLAVSLADDLFRLKVAR